MYGIMAKTAKHRASSFFDASAMKRLTVFFGGSPFDHKGREGTQTPPPPSHSPPPPPPPSHSPPPPPPPPPHIMDSLSQRNDGVDMKTTNVTPVAPGLSPPVPLPSAMVIPPRVQSLAPPMDGTTSHPTTAGSFSSSYLHPQSSNTSPPVTSARTSGRNFSGASAMSAISAASHTSYASSQLDSPLAHVPIPPSPIAADMPKQLRKQQQQQRHGIFGKRRKDDVAIPAAWRLTHASSEHLEGYDFGPLVQGGLVR